MPTPSERPGLLVRPFFESKCRLSTDTFPVTTTFPFLEDFFPPPQWADCHGYFCPSTISLPPILSIFEFFDHSPFFIRKPHPLRLCSIQTHPKQSKPFLIAPPPPGDLPTATLPPPQPRSLPLPGHLKGLPEQFPRPPPPCLPRTVIKPVPLSTQLSG